MLLFFISSPYLPLMLLSHLHPHNLNRRTSPLPSWTSLYYRCGDLDKKCLGTLGEGHTFQTGCIFCFDMSESKQRNRKKEKKMLHRNFSLNICTAVYLQSVSLDSHMERKKKSLSGCGVSLCSHADSVFFGQHERFPWIKFLRK